MQKITFTKDSILVSIWDEVGEKWQDRSIADSNLPLSWYLPYEVFIDPGVTIKDVLGHLTRYLEQVNFLFINQLRGLSLDDVIKILEEAKSEKSKIQADEMCIIWVGKIIDDDEDDMINIYPALMAIEIDPDSDVETFHSAHDLEVDQLLGLEFSVDDFLELFNENNPAQTELSGIVSWRMFDFIGGLLEELVTYSFANRLIQISELSNLPPMTSIELFKHMESLDKFFNNGQNDN